MPLADLTLVFQWWGTLFLIGAAAYPLTGYLFRRWFDRGFLFTKAVGMATVTFVVYLGGILRLVPFTQGAVWGAMGLVFALGLLVQSLGMHTEASGRTDGLHARERWKDGLLFFLEELGFFAALLLWSWVKAHEPSIHALEKYMDYGFAKAILNSRFFPAQDMWYAGFSINYYYFGHTVMAVLTRLSGIDLTYTFNLMLATIFAFTATMSFAIGVQFSILGHHVGSMSSVGGRLKSIVSGLLTAFLVTLAGNMQTLYAFTRGYTGDAVKPFWQLLWPIQELWQNLPVGMATYWYANATRFIPYAIHEFPSYSFVVSDVHGHVLSLPFVLLAIALLVTLFGFDRTHKAHEAADMKSVWMTVGFYGFLCGVLLMTNALDGPIYLGLFLIVLALRHVLQRTHEKTNWRLIGITAGVAVVMAGVTSVPFLMHFSSFVNGLAVNCPPALFADTRVGPILFEGVEKCQHSPLWMMWLLWGFFWYCGAWLLAGLYRRIRKTSAAGGIQPHEILLAVFFVFSLLLIIFPEFFYFKDIYPMHFRSNTMFKLGYQAFIMFSIVSGYTIVTILFRAGTRDDLFSKVARILFFVFLVPQLFLVSIYPIFSVRSYFDSLKHYEGLYGLGWLREQYPDDWMGINWLNEQIRTARPGYAPVIVEADGDSYTDYDRVSAFTGLPTVIGWPVHEWLWRGSYDVVSPRREEVRQIYESGDVNATADILTKYRVSFVVVGELERQKFTNLQEAKFSALGTPVFTHGKSTIYEIR